MEACWERASGRPHRRTTRLKFDRQSRRLPYLGSSLRTHRRRTQLHFQHPRGGPQLRRGGPQINLPDERGAPPQTLRRFTQRRNCRAHLSHRVGIARFWTSFPAIEHALRHIRDVCRRGPWTAACIANGMRTLFNDARYGWRTLARSPAIHRRLAADPDPRHRCEHGDFQCRERRAPPRAAFSRCRPAGYGLGGLYQTGLSSKHPAPGNYADWKADRNIFDDAAALALRTYNLSGDGAPEKLDGAGVTSNLFRVLGIEPVLGRTFTETEDKPGADSRGVD